MKRIAITPETSAAGRLVQHITRLPERGVDCVYIRASLPDAALALVAHAVDNAGMVPIVHYRRARALGRLPCGVHVKSHELDALAAIGAGHRVITAACHDTGIAALVLRQAVADYVFISPVFPPHSKPLGSHALLPRAAIEMLVGQYGDRVVLLGGMDMQLIRQMHAALPGDFSVAGISMFFPAAELMSCGEDKNP